jgi:hypothetical protein
VTSTESNPTLAVNWGTRGSDYPLTASNRVSFWQMSMYTESETFGSTTCSSGFSPRLNTVPTFSTTSILIPSTTYITSETADPITTTVIAGTHAFYNMNPGNSIVSSTLFAVTGIPYSSFFSQECAKSKHSGLTTWNNAVVTFSPVDIDAHKNCMWDGQSLTCENFTPSCTTADAISTSNGQCEVYGIDIMPTYCSWSN